MCSQETRAGASHCLNGKRNSMGSSVQEMQLYSVYTPLPRARKAASPIVQDKRVPSEHWNMVLVCLEWKRGVVPYFSHARDHHLSWACRYLYNLFQPCSAEVGSVVTFEQHPWASPGLYMPLSPHLQSCTNSRYHKMFALLNSLL